MTPDPIRSISPPPTRQRGPGYPIDEIPHQTPAYGQGFETLEDELEVDGAPVSGTIPSWLRGTLLRTGPAKFEVGDQEYNHWFDGLGMLHRLSLSNGEVSYGNKFIQSRAYLHAMENQQISFREFATDPDKERFKRVNQGFEPHGTDNPIVSVVRMNDKVLAMTQTPLPVEIDPKTLNTIGVYDFEDDLPDGFTTPHPHVDPEDGSLYNFTISLDPPVSHNLYRLDRATGRRHLLTTIPTDAPSFVNSFAMTERFVILVEQPFRLDYMSLIAGEKPFIQCFNWLPESPAMFWIIDKTDGEVMRRFDTDAFFFLHHINAFRVDDDFVVDMITYRDPGILQALYLKNLRAGGTIPLPQPRRFRLNLRDGSVHSEPLGDAFVELPRINYKMVNGRPYRYFYGFGGYGSLFGNEKVTFDSATSLVKVDTVEGSTKAWRSPGCFPGEPVFVAEPRARAEDDGVLLSLVLDSNYGTSFLLVLDARTMAELARAELPHAVPFTLGGDFFPDEGQEKPDQVPGDTSEAQDYFLSLINQFK